MDQPQGSTMNYRREATNKNETQTILTQPWIMPTIKYNLKTRHYWSG